MATDPNSTGTPANDPNEPWLTPKAAICITVATMGGSLALLLLVWWLRYDFNLEHAALVGDAVTPLVAPGTLLAVGAALYSLHLQQKEMAAEHREKRHTLLREAYAPLLAATRAYLDGVTAYREWFDRDLLSSNPADSVGRKVERDKVTATYRDVTSAVWRTRLVDANQRRYPLVEDATAPIAKLESKSDNREAHRVYLLRLDYEVASRKRALYTLTRDLLGELGTPVPSTKSDDEVEAERIVTEHPEATTFE